jgi:2-polyprenyl-3-methyl-5-hydroxy-6-metoxy-1,4-benzoquinol methylase
MRLSEDRIKPFRPGEIFPMAPEEVVDKWDREWMTYLATEAKEPHLVRYAALDLAADIQDVDRREVFGTALTRFRNGPLNAALRIWARGDEIVGRNVAEIGCGAGFLGKQLGLICNSYIGLDVSAIAIAIARGNSPSTCTYLHLWERQDIFAEFGKYDTMVGREFFIHQNIENALWITNLGGHLLKPGGVICADFYLPNRAIAQGVLHPAKSPLDEQYASCAFIFSDSEIHEVASHSNLTVESIENDLSEQRKFVVFRKS